jgi:hypothetical protein
MPNKLTELGKLIAEKEQDYRGRQQRIDRLDKQHDAGAYRRFKNFGEYVDSETGEKNYQENADELGKEIEKLRKEYLDAEAEAEELDVEEAIASDKKRKQAKDFKDREAAEKARGAEPVERSMIKKAAAAKALEQAAKSRLGKGALKKLGGKAMSPALQLMMLIAGPGAQKMLKDYETKKKPVGMRPPEA